MPFLQSVPVTMILWLINNVVNKRDNIFTVKKFNSIYYNSWSAAKYFNSSFS